MVVTDSLNTVQKYLSRADENSLVVFDCDDVLTTLAEQLWKPSNREFFHEWCENNIANYSEQELYDTATFILMSTDHYLVNDHMPAVVSALQNKNVKTVVLTALANKPIANVGDPVTWRIETLEKFGYTFWKSWQNLPTTEFTNIKCSYPPVYRSGVICCGDAPKGESLAKFLDYAKFKPNRVIFIDDLTEQLENVQQMCQSHGLEFTGIQYLEARNIFSKIPFSKERMEYQLQILRQQNIWISDLQAEEILRTRFEHEKIQHQQ